MTWRFLMFLIRKIFTTSLITISHHCEVLLFDIQFLKSITPNYSLKLLAFILHFWNVIYQQKIVIKISWAVWELKPRAIFHAGTFWDTELSKLPSSLCIQYRVLFDTNHHNLTQYKSNWNSDWGGENKLPLSYPCHALGPQNWNTTMFNVCLSCIRRCLTNIQNFRWYSIFAFYIPKIFHKMSTSWILDVWPLASDQILMRLPASSWASNPDTFPEFVEIKSS